MKLIVITAFRESKIQRTRRPCFFLWGMRGDASTMMALLRVLVRSVYFGLAALAGMICPCSCLLLLLCGRRRDVFGWFGAVFSPQRDACHFLCTSWASLPLWREQKLFIINKLSSKSSSHHPPARQPVEEISSLLSFWRSQGNTIYFRPCHHGLRGKILVAQFHFNTNSYVRNRFNKDRSGFWRSASAGLSALSLWKRAVNEVAMQLYAQGQQQIIQSE